MERFKKTGYTAKVGSEIEFYLLDSEKKPLFGGKETYSIGKIGWYSDIVDEILKNLEAFNIPVEAIHTEYGPGQMEMILQYGDALTNADNAVIAKNTVKEIVRKRGLYATFMAFPFNGISGSGYHLHQSLWTAAGKNAFNEDRGLLLRYAAGILSGTSEFMALAAPTVNSYKRVFPICRLPRHG